MPLWVGHVETAVYDSQQHTLSLVARWARCMTDEWLISCRTWNDTLSTVPAIAMMFVKSINMRATLFFAPELSLTISIYSLMKVSQIKTYLA